MQEQMGPGPLSLPFNSLGAVVLWCHSGQACSEQAWQGCLSCSAESALFDTVLLPRHRMIQNCSARLTKICKAIFLFFALGFGSAPFKFFQRICDYLNFVTCKDVVCRRAKESPMWEGRNSAIKKAWAKRMSASCVLSFCKQGLLL